MIRSLSAGLLAVFVFEFLRYDRGWIYKQDELLLTQINIFLGVTILWFIGLLIVGDSRE